MPYMIHGVPRYIRSYPGIKHAMTHEGYVIKQTLEETLAIQCLLMISQILTNIMPSLTLIIHYQFC